MSFVVIEPEMLTRAAGDLQSIGSAVSAGKAAATAPTMGVVPAIYDMFVSTIVISRGSYAAIEAANPIAAS
jgi:PE family